MEKKQKKVEYIEWLRSDVMHEASRNWLSELRFIKDEQRFFETLIKSYTLHLIDSEHFTENKVLIDTLSTLIKKNKLFIEIVKTHENELLIMVDGTDQLRKEKAYKSKHREITIDINNYFKDYRNLKKRLFETIENIMKHEKQKRLLQ